MSFYTDLVIFGPLAMNNLDSRKGTVAQIVPLSLNKWLNTTCLTEIVAFIHVPWTYPKLSTGCLTTNYSANSFDVVHLFILSNSLPNGILHSLCK